jgi:hypothetical protein
LALSRKTGRFIKCWHYPKNQADWKNIGAFQKNRWIYKMLALFQKSGGFPKYRRLQKIRQPYCLGSLESPAADFLLVWLKSSHSDPRRCVASLSCSPQVRDGLPACCFYLRALSRTVPAGCTSPTSQYVRKSKN